MATDREYTEALIDRMLDYQNLAESWALSKLDDSDQARATYYKATDELERESWERGRNIEREDMELVSMLREAADRLEQRYKK